MIMAKNRVTIRFSERTMMILNEIADKTGAKVSLIIRSLVIKGIEELTDESGNLKLNEKQIQKE